MAALCVILVAMVTALSAFVIGWMRVAKRLQPRTALSLAGFVLATFSVMPLIYCFLLAGVHLYTYSPPLFRLYKWGTVLGLVGLILSIGGVFQRNTLRWLAPLLSISMIIVWHLWTIDVT
jgi:hypothetical protein